MSDYRISHKVGPDPKPYHYEHEIFVKGLNYERPSITFDSTRWELLAKSRLSAESFGDVGGSAGTAETCQKNLASLKSCSIVPNHLVKADFPNVKAKVLGAQYPLPIALAPVGVQRIFHSQGESGAAGAATAEGVPYILSTASSTSIEDVTKANEGGTRWYQLYWPSNEHNDITISLLKRAKAAGYSVLFFTFDAYML